MLAPAGCNPTLIGLLIGDGQLNYSAEEIFEAYYAYQVTKNFTVRPTFIDNPAYNADRFRSFPAACTANSRGEVNGCVLRAVCRVGRIRRNNRRGSVSKIGLTSLASPAILPEFLADHAINTRLAFSDRNRPFGSLSRDLSDQLGADRRSEEH